jgi:hypothetical protein
MADEGNGIDIRTDLRKYLAFSALTDQVRARTGQEGGKDSPEEPLRITRTSTQ